MAATMMVHLNFLIRFSVKNRQKNAFFSPKIAIFLNFWSKNGKKRQKIVFLLKIDSLSLFRPLYERF